MLIYKGIIVAVIVQRREFLDGGFVFILCADFSRVYIVVAIYSKIVLFSVYIII